MLQGVDRCSPGPAGPPGPPPQHLPMRTVPLSQDPQHRLGLLDLPLHYEPPGRLKKETGPAIKQEEDTRSGDHSLQKSPVLRDKGQAQEQEVPSHPHQLPCQGHPKPLGWIAQLQAHQIDTKVNPGKQKAQEESEGHDACGGACSSSSHSTGPTSPKVSSTIPRRPNLSAG